MRIALIECYQNPTPDYGVLADLLRQRGHTVYLGTTDADSDMVWHDGRQTVARQPRHLRLNNRLGKLRKASVFKRLEDLWFVRQMRRFLRHQQVEIVQLNPASLHWAGLLPLWMPMVFVLDWRQISQRDAGRGLNWLKNRWAEQKRFLYSIALYDCATFLHAAGAEKVLGREWQRWGKIVPLGVNPAFLRLRVDDVPRQDRVDKVTFLYLGTINRIRRLERLLHAAKAIMAVTPNFRIDFVGPDTTEGYYHGLVEELGLGEVVAFCPSVSYLDVPATILRHDVALAYVPEYPLDRQYHPTLKVIEYGAIGVPIIATDFAPNREMVTDGVNGLLVENSVAALTQAMLRFITDRAFLADCLRNAQSRRRGTPWNEVAEHYEQTVYLPLWQKRQRGIQSSVSRSVQRVGNIEE